MTPAPMDPSPPQGQQLQGPLSQSAVEQEKAMFQHLISVYAPPQGQTPKTSRAPSTKRPRPGHQKEETEDALMPAAGSTDDPFRQGQLNPRGRHPKGWSKGGRSKGLGKGRGKGFGKSNYSGPSQEGGPWSAEVDYYSIDRESMMGQMARMLIRHERQLQSLQQDQKLHLFLRPASAVPLMVKVARTWRELMDAGKVRSSLRETMLRELIQELKSRIQGFNARPEMKEKAMQMNWTDSQGAWNYLRWNPETQKEELVPQVESRTTGQILEDLQAIENLINGTTIRHFGSVRPFRQHYETSWVQFTLEIELRTDGDILWKHFNALINSSVLHLLAARLRRDRRIPSGITQLHLIGCDLLAIRLLNPTSSTCYMNSLLILADCMGYMMPYNSTQAGWMLASTCIGSCLSVRGCNLFGNTMWLSLLSTLCVVCVFLLFRDAGMLDVLRFNAEGRGKWKRTVKSLHQILHVLEDVMIPIFADVDSLQNLRVVICEDISPVSLRVPYGIEVGVGDLTLQLIDELLLDAEDLCRHNFGHHVVQSVLEHGHERHRKIVAKVLGRDLLGFAKHRNASYLVEKAMWYCAPE
ncbi:unnamed protein product, partial [Symbiodinium necroappetens]